MYKQEHCPSFIIFLHSYLYLDSDLSIKISVADVAQGGK